MATMSRRPSGSKPMLDTPRWDAGHHFAGARKVHGQDFTRAHIREPEAIVVPARRFTEDEADQQDVWLRR